MIINKKRFKKILTYDHKQEKILKNFRKKERFSQMIISKNKCVQITFYRHEGVNVSSIVDEVIKGNFKLLWFFYEKFLQA